MHINGIDYNQATDQILISVHNWSEIWVIDHALSTSEAAGHLGGLRNAGGDLLWRWGNPLAYGRGDSTNQLLFDQHNAQWIKPGLPDAGKILVFNNGLNRPEGNFSTIEMLSPPADNNGNYDKSIIPYGPANADWTYKNPGNPESFYEPFISGVQMLPNGNVLVCGGVSGTFFEVTPQKKIAWKYMQPVNNNGPIIQGQPAENTLTFRCTQYPYSYPAFDMHHLTQGQPIEKGPLNYTCVLNIKTGGNGGGGGGGGTGIETVFNSSSFKIYPNPASDHIFINAPGRIESISIYNTLGEKIMETNNNNNIDVSTLTGGLYIVKALCNGIYYSQKIDVRH